MDADRKLSAPARREKGEVKSQKQNNQEPGTRNRTHPFHFPPLRLRPAPMRPLVLTVQLLLTTLAMAQERPAADAIAELRRQEVLDQSAHSQRRTDLERYLTVILLPAGAVLLCMLVLRRNI